MPKFLVTYMAAKPGTMKVDVNEEQSRRFMQEWGAWAERHRSALVESGLPVGKTKLVDQSGVSATQNAVTGYSVVEAASHDAAAELFRDHPHVTIMGLSVEVMECLAIPEM